MLFVNTTKRYVFNLDKYGITINNFPERYTEFLNKENTRFFVDNNTLFMICDYSTLTYDLKTRKFEDGMIYDLMGGNLFCNLKAINNNIFIFEYLSNINERKPNIFRLYYKNGYPITSFNYRSEEKCPNIETTSNKIYIHSNNFCDIYGEDGKIQERSALRFIKEKKIISFMKVCDEGIYIKPEFIDKLIIIKDVPYDKEGIFLEWILDKSFIESQKQ